MVAVPNGGGSSSSTFTTPARTSPGNGTATNGTRSRMGGIPLPGNGASQNGNMTIPLSARKAQPLCLSTVERRGAPNEAREVSKSGRLFGLQEAPTFWPTEEEFKDPMEYMRKIAPEGMKYGIVKIVPPDTWKPPFAIDTESFHFRTRRQELNSVEGGTRANLNYLDQLAKFHKQHGTNLNRFPSVDKRPLDLYKLKKAVETRGGFDRVCKGKKWAEIGRDLGYSGKIMSSLSTSLKNSYQKWLHPYEEYLRIAKPGVYQQLEYENGGPYTPSPGPSPAKRPQPQSASSLAGDSPAVRASAALNVSMQDGPAPAASEPPRPPMTSGFTAVNTGGFTAVNAAATLANGFSAINAPNGVHRDTANGQATPQRLNESPFGSAHDTPDLRPSATSGSPFANAPALNPLKRQMSHEPDGGANGDSDAAGRRSKRLKKDAAPTVAGSHMTQPRMPTPRLHAPRDRSIEKPGDRCEACGKADDPAAILLCDSCENGYHRHCLEPRLKSTPDYDWHCPRCLVGTGEFGFEEGGVYSLKQFQEKANNFKENYFASKTHFDPVLNVKKPVSEDDVEREFWRLVESITETVEVEYGADIHSTTHGSGFPTIEKNPRDPYATDPWNLNILPFNPESLFRHIKNDITGMTIPWLYVGMCFSTFCWHNEDHYTYSANYQHFGATKTWYGIPAEDAAKFEDAMREAVPELFETQPDLLFQLVTLLTPEQLKKAGVRVYALDQRAGQFVITFPQAYHAGFNHGFNFNEAVNFAPSDWEPYGEAGVQRLQDFRRQPCFSHDELLLTAATQQGSNSIKKAKWLAPALERMLDRELRAREDFRQRHKPYENHACRIFPLYDNADSEQPPCDLVVEYDAEDPSEEEMICTFCKSYGYLSRFICTRSSKTMCLLHAGLYECCDEAAKNPGSIPAFGGHVVRHRIPDDALRAVVQKVVDKARVPEAWAEKLNKVTEDDPRPSLKALRSLLAEGEKIQWVLPQLPPLRKYVERCNEWVEEATNYITRKQQNRRKNERAWRKSNAAKAAEMEERERELRNVDNVRKLLDKADDLSFDCPEIDQLQERADKIAEFQQNARAALVNHGLKSTQDLEDLAEVGKSYNVDIPEIESLEKLVQHQKWLDKVQSYRKTIPTLQDVVDSIKEGLAMGIREEDLDIRHLQEQKQQGELWEAKVKEVMAVENVHYQQLDALSRQATQFPVSPETLMQVDAILKKQRDAQEQIMALYERSKDPDFRKRPMYKEVRDAMEALNELNSKPSGTIDLEREQKRHEDWMRRGKKLFGKANAPLHILQAHMQIVEARNEACFDLNDKPRMPVEPSSREVTPMDPEDHEDGGNRDVFCICRKPEAGLMIECELCHEWYHGKCLKIARGKVKGEDGFTCPICDYRVKIPRDATRPKLEDLQAWQDELLALPFQPEEEECLRNIIDHATDFRNFVKAYMNPLSTPDDLSIQRFYLRKIEGADILLADETNYFKREVHKWAPVADVPPPILDVSLSTRKPRPTKQQKAMKELGITNPDDLPAHLRPKTQPTKSQSRKPSKAQAKKPQHDIQPTPQESHTPPGLPHGYSAPPTDTSTPIPSTQDHFPGFLYNDPPTTSAFTNSPLFAASNVFTQSSRPLSPPPNFGALSESGAPLDPGLFASPHPFASSGSQGNMDNIFNDLTNHEDGLMGHVEEGMGFVD